ncbi:MAG: histidinol-phosphate transaminase [Methylococcales bacterium]|jgi:histidinol-phosphate aminotransferase|nr:histidinol-phosphate transaminase [Methylococcales bacterium]
MRNIVEALIRPEIIKLSAYHVPESDDMIKLDAMENPYQWSSDIEEKWLEKLKMVNINRYPDPTAKIVVNALRQAMNIPQKADVILGNGSDELIQIIAMAVAKPDSCILAPSPSFVMYQMIALSCQLGFIPTPLNADFSLNLQQTKALIKQHQPAVTFLAYPNNPTGNLFDRDELMELIEISSGLVVIDEAYAPFTDCTLMNLAGQIDNLLVMRTVSKMGLAGLRLGLLAGIPDLIQQFDKVRLPYNINSLTQASIEFALENQNIFNQQTNIIRQQRQKLLDQLKQFKQLTAYPSQANFILFKLHEIDASEVFNQLKDHGILIKNMNQPNTLLDNCCRVTIGKPEENEQFLKVLSCLIN